MMYLPRLALALIVLLVSLTSARAHALEPGYLDLRQLTPESWQVFWRKPDVNGAPMKIDARLPGNCVARHGPQPSSDGAAWIAAWVAQCPAGLEGRELAIPGLRAQRTDVLVRVQPLDREATTIRLTPDEPSYQFAAVAPTGEVFLSYLALGFDHILEGWDHLLFVFALLILVRTPWQLVGAVTAFTAAHSITLALATLGHLTIPGPPVEACIALSIVFLAVEILKHEDGRDRLSERFPWLVSFIFGLLHGLGFAGALTEIGLPQDDIPAALFAFNLGVEAGQLTFVAFVFAALWLLRSAVPGIVARFRQSNAPGEGVLGYVVGGVATFWLIERVMAF